MTRDGARVEDIELGRSEVRLAEVMVAQKQEALEYHYLKSPFDGVISKNNFEVNDLVDMNQTIFELMDINKVYLDIRVSEMNIVRVKVGQKVEVALDCLGGKKFDGVIKQIDPLGGKLDRSYLSRIEIDNADGVLKPGMFGRAVIITERIANAIAVSAGALKRDVQNPENSQQYVLVANSENEVQRMDVIVGKTFGDKVYIVDGLDAGMKVILLGYGLNIGDKVKIVE